MVKCHEKLAYYTEYVYTILKGNFEMNIKGEVREVFG